MKATGIVRKIDDLGRVVIPKEIRHTLHIREGDPLEIFLNEEKCVIFRKYSPVGDMVEFAEQYAKVLSKTIDQSVLICDNDCVIAVGGVSKKECLDRKLSAKFESYMQLGQQYISVNACHDLFPVEGVNCNASVVCPIITSGNKVNGAVIILFNKNNTPPTKVEVKLAQVAASVLGEQLEGY